MRRVALKVICDDKDLENDIVNDVIFHTTGICGRYTHEKILVLFSSICQCNFMWFNTG